MKAERYKRYSEEYFGKLASNYDDEGFFATVKGDYPDILEELEKEPCIDVLDCGCGTGAIIALLNQCHPEMRFTGIDLTAEMVDKAEKLNLPNATFIQGDCEHLPFKEESFDAIICSHSFHHYPHAQDFFKSAFRVLRPNGRLIIRDNTGPALWLFAMNHLKIPYENLFVHSGDFRFYSRREVQRFCEAARLSLELFEERPVHKMHCVARKGGTTSQGKQSSTPALESA